MAGPNDDQPIAATRVSPTADAAPAADVAAAPAADVAAVGDVALAPEAKVELVSEKPSLLEQVEAPAPGAKEGDKPAADVKPAEGDKPKEGDKPAAETVKPEAQTDKKDSADVKPAAEGDKPAAEAQPTKPEAVTYEYSVPETLKIDDTTRGELHTALDAFRADPTKGAQGLIDLHNRTVTKAIDQVRADQHKLFNETRDGWNKEIMADEQLGGAGYATASKAVARMRDLLVSRHPSGSAEYKADHAAFETFLRITGAGDHPAFWRVLHNAARYFDEPSLPMPGATPTKHNGQPPGRRRDALYDHPSSKRS